MHFKKFANLLILISNVQKKIWATRAERTNRAHFGWKGPTGAQKGSLKCSWLTAQEKMSPAKYLCGASLKWCLVRTVLFCWLVKLRFLIFFYTILRFCSRNLLSIEYIRKNSCRIEPRVTRFRNYHRGAFRKYSKDFFSVYI